MEDPSIRNRLAKKFRFHSSADSTKQTTLETYVGRMKEKQQAIYYVAGTSREALENSQFVKPLLEKGFEVLYLTEPNEEYSIQLISDFEGKQFQNVAKEGIKLEQEDKSEEEHKLLEEKSNLLCHYHKGGLNNKYSNIPSKSNRHSKSGSAKVAKCTSHTAIAPSSSALMHNCHQFSNHSCESTSSQPNSCMKSLSQWQVGDQIRCLWKSIEYAAKIEEKLEYRGQIYYRIHYIGWTRRMDELIGQKEAESRFRAWNSSDLPPGKFNIDRLCGKRIHKKRLEYLVHWEGYGDEEDTWEPANRLKTDGCEWAIKEYESDVNQSLKRELSSSVSANFISHPVKRELSSSVSANFSDK